jgi:hypothetical protein
MAETTKKVEFVVACTTKGQKTVLESGNPTSQDVRQIFLLDELEKHSWAEYCKMLDKFVQKNPIIKKQGEIKDFKACVTRRTLVRRWISVEYTPQKSQDLPKLKWMSKHYDGAKWGPGDWYEDVRESLVNELAKGPDHHWTTGWYGVKKEIVSGKLSCDGRGLWVEVSVSDDFDTNGVSERNIPFTTDLDLIHKVFNEVWDEASEDQKENRDYVGFSVLTKRRVYGFYVGGKPQGKGRMQMACVETYIGRNNDGWMMEEPPGDNYYQWGFQGECEIPENVKEKLAKWAEEWNGKQKEYRYKGWVIKPWEDE